MPSKEIIEKLIQAVETESHDQVIQNFYAEDASIQENKNEPRIGLENLVKNEREMLQNASSVQSKCILPYFIAEDKVVIRWKFRFEWKNNTVTEIEEIAYQKWKGDKIYEEQFFYDPAQFRPKPKE
ncbi:MAG: nuclear transport factor 2 family protein [Bacteroidota bacterium]